MSALAHPAPWPAWYRVARNGLSVAPVPAVHLTLLAIPFIPLTWTAAVLLVVVIRTAGLGITVGFHRYFSHRSFRTSRAGQFALGVAGCLALQKGPLWWAVYHRVHHRHADRPGDPHSPVRDGFWYAHCGWLFANNLLRRDHHSVRDLTPYPELVWLDRLWMAPGLAAAGACYLAGGLPGLVYGFCLGTVLVFQATLAVNSVGHRFGPRRFDTPEGSRNNWALGVVAMGEGWHNNHHRHPWSARHGLAWYEIDHGFLVIRCLRRLGLAWDVREPPEGATARGASGSPRPPSRARTAGGIDTPPGTPGDFAGVGGSRVRPVGGRVGAQAADALEHDHGLGGVIGMSSPGTCWWTPGGRCTWPTSVWPGSGPPRG